MKGNCETTGKVVGVIRILLALAMIYFGVTKFGADASMQAFVGGAAHNLGLTFLSTTVWFWLAVAGEILAGLLLLSGCKKFAKLGAILTLIVMVFAVSAAGFNTNAIVISIAALVVLIMGPGCRGFCKAKCCNDGTCCKGESCDDGSCDTPKAAACSACGNDPCTCNVGQQEQQEEQQQEQQEQQQE